MERTAFGTVIGLWVAGLGAAAQFGKVSVSYDMLSGHYHASGPSLGFAVSLVGFIGILFGVVAGLLVARIGYRRALIAALGLGALMSFYQATLPALPLFLVSRAVEGASHLAIVVAAPTLIAQISAPRHRGFTLSLWSTFFGVAFSLLVWFGVPLAEKFGVGALYGAHGAYMACMAILVAQVLPRDVFGSSDENISLSIALSAHWRIYRSPRLCAPALGWVSYAGAWVAILTLMPQFLPPETRSFVIGLMPIAGIVSSMTVGVWMLRYLQAVQVIQIGFVLCLGASVALWLNPQIAGPYLALALAMGLVQGSSFTAIAQLNVTPEARAEANGALAQMGNVGTTLGTPILAALIAGLDSGGFLLFALGLYSFGLISHILLARRRLQVDY